jgi:general secretion pathway protein E/type IV pilus assembly protein PilB
MNKSIEDTIRHSSSEREIWKAAHDQNIRRLAQDGIVKVLRGITSLEELGRVVDLHDESIFEMFA